VRLIVARFLAPKLFRVIIFLGALIAGSLFLVLFAFHGQFIPRVRAQGGVWYPMMIFGLAGLAYAMWTELLFLRQALFDRRNALWIENGNLVYISKIYVSRKCEDIVDVSTGTIGRYKFPSIVLTSRDGSRKSIPSGALSEPREGIIHELRMRIGL
jgi:hypothetical protein